MKPAIYALTFVYALLLFLGEAHSAGVAVLKEQTFHDDSSATAVVFTEIFDSDGPYLRIVSGNKDIDILRSNLVGRIELSAEIPTNIMTAIDTAPLRSMLADIVKFIARYPKSAPLLKENVSDLQAHIKRFDAGDVRFEGMWISKKELASIKEVRWREFKAEERIEVEKRVFEAAQRDKGLVKHAGRWLTKQQIEQLPPGLATELSESIEPLWNGDLHGAKLAVQNLMNLSSRQTGAPKVRTERLTAVVRNLFYAEVCLSQRIIASAGDAKEAAKHDRNAKEWLIPNGFGTIRKDESLKSSEKAKEIRQSSAELLTQCKRDLMDQLRETDVVTDDFYKLREYIVVLVLAKAVRSVSSRHFTAAEFRSSFPEQSLASVRDQVIRDQNLTTTN